ncbi:MAG: HAD family phosphatase [Candidatus Omnitrophica bacterium]|nr:HAD family phosphatase [Candidatus Omnitrophota bacterium]
MRSCAIMAPMVKQPKGKYNSVIFDMDGVITNTMPYHFDAWFAVFKSAGIKVDCLEIYRREGQDGLTTVREIFSQNRRKISLKEAKAFLSNKEQLFKKIVKIKFVKGSRPFIRSLKAHKFKLGLVTGTSRHEAEKILPSGLLKLFDVIVTGDEVKNGKPYPEPFLKALKKLKITQKDALVIENAPFGIQSAKKAGLFCAALETSLPRKYLSGADLIFKSFVELRNNFSSFL